MILVEENIHHFEGAMMNKKLKFLLLSLCVSSAYANDTTGYISTSGVQYIKNKDIQMYSEDLYISKDKIKVDYQFKNLSNRNITETILFPLPKVENVFESDFADTEGLLSSFKVQVDGKSIQPTMHVRAYIAYGKENARQTIDVTQAFKECGFSEQDLLNPWTRKNTDYEHYINKIRQCQHPKLKPYIGSSDDYIEWLSEVVYSWKQTFKAKSMTRVQHQYQPLVGGAVSLYMENDAKQFCMDQSFKNGLKKRKGEITPYSALGYLLTTGANWAKPIEDFKLTIERDKDELVSFCWNGKVKKISPTQFQMVERKFTPKQDIDIIFVKPMSLNQ